MIRRIEVLESLNHDKQEIILALFNEIDQDGSGNIDKLEFRFLLRALKLTFSNDRFNRLFRAVDTSGDGMLSVEELFDLLFPNYDPDDEDENEDKQSRPSQSRRGRTSSADCPPIPEEEEGPGPSQGLQRLRSLSQISDYSDTDSENDDKEKEKKKKKGSGVVQETCRDEDDEDDDDDSARTPPSVLRQRNTKANTSANKIVPAITSSMSSDSHDYNHHSSHNQHFVHGDGKDHEGDGCFNSVGGSSSRPLLFSADNRHHNNSGDMHMMDHGGDGNQIDGEEDGKDSHEL